MLKKITKHMGFALKQSLFWLLSALVPKNKRLWVFGAWQGRVYADNTKYLFEYVNKSHQDIHCVWITKNPSVAEQVRALGYQVYCLPSWGAYITLLRAGVVIQTEGNRDMGGFRLCWTKVVQLWHGVAPKKADWNKGRSKAKQLYDKLFIDDVENSYLMASSPKNCHTMNEVLGFSLERSYPTGYPRNDVFVMQREPSLLKQELDAKYPGCKKIIYMPTHRNFGTEGVAFSSEELLRIDRLLQENRVVMVFKPHFHELKNYLDIESALTNIILAKDEKKYADVYSYIGDFDLLISDYSSIVYDFTCTKKPIVLFPYDLEKFKNTDAGLFDFYEDVPAGPLCYTWDEVLKNVVLLLEEDNWREKREKCRQMFHPYDDGNNSMRVYRTICDNVLNLR